MYELVFQEDRHWGLYDFHFDWEEKMSEFSKENEKENQEKNIDFQEFYQKIYNNLKYKEIMEPENIEEK